MQKSLSTIVAGGTVLTLLLMTSMFAKAQAQANSRNPVDAVTQTDQTDATARVSTPLDYVTSWIGNSLPGNSEGPGMTMRHAPIGIADMYVAPNGTVYTNTGWDEGGRAVSIFQDGKLISAQSGNAGGNAIALYQNYLIAGQSSNSGCNSSNASPNDGCGLAVLNANTLQNIGVSFNSGASGANLYATYNIFGVAVSQDKLYISEWDNNLVEIYDLTPLKAATPGNPNFLVAVPVQNPVRIAVDSSGGFWVTHRDPNEDLNAIGEIYDLNEMWGTDAIDHYDSSGNHLSTLILPAEQDGSSAEVAAISIVGGTTMLVADNGTDSNIKIYTNITTTPTLSGTFGTTGGYYSSSVPGVREPKLLRQMIGVSADANGNYYIAQNGAGLSLDGGEQAHGNVLQSYNSSTGALNWELDGLEFVSLATIDPQTGTDVYDPYHHYKMDFSKGPGQEATYYSDTYDRFKYPDDIRVTTNQSGNGSVARGEIHYINGNKFLGVTPQSGGWYALYRYTDPTQEVPVFSVLWDYGSWYGSQDLVVEPPMADNDTEFIWRDTTGNGSVANGTFEEPSGVAPLLQEHRDGQDFFLDTNGDMWQINYAINQPPYEQSIHMRRYKLQGLDSNGVPEYDYDTADGHLIIYNVPTDFPDFTQIGNMAFYPSMSKGGTLFVQGQNAGGVPMIERYDGWDTGSRTASFTTYLPWQQNAGCPGPNQWDPTSFTVGGNFFFVDFWCPHYNLVYRADTGAYVGRLIPQDNVGGPSAAGDSDIPDPNMAYLNPATNEIDLFQEEDYQAKTLMYRWTPPSTLPAPPAPQAAPGQPSIASADDEVLNGLTWTASSSPNVVSYQLSWSTTSGGPYTPIQGGMAPPNPPLNYTFEQNGTWYFVVQAQDETGQFSPYSPELAASTIPYGKTYEAEQGLLLGPGGTPGGGAASCPTGIYTSTSNSAGARVGCMQGGSTITLTVTPQGGAGTYHVRFYYDNGDSSACQGGTDIWQTEIVVNGGTPIETPCLPPTGGGNWSIPGFVYVDLPLNAGSNTIVIGNPESGNPESGNSNTTDVDRIVVPAAPGEAPASNTVDLQAAPSFNFTVSPTALTVTGGQSGTVTVQVTPLNSFSSPVSFSCTNLPSGASCSFAPATVTPSGAAASTTLTVTTTSTSSAALRHNSAPWFPGSVMAIAFCCFGWKKRRAVQMLAILVALTVSMCSGCGRAVQVPGSTTQQQTETTITVVATSGSLQQTASFTLTVQ